MRCRPLMGACSVYVCDATRTPPPDAHFLARLAALRPERVFDSGWQARSTGSDGSAVLAKNGWMRVARAGAWAYGSDGRAWVEVPGLYPGPAGTFAFLHGRVPGDGDEQGNLFRVYLHTRPGCAAEVLASLVTSLDAQQLPFTLKTRMAPASAFRADATVLYVSRRYHQGALACVRRLPPKLLDGLGRAAPLFSLPLRRGVAVAEDPPTGESFGMHRLRLVVEAILELWQDGVQDAAARRSAVEARFLREGLRLDAPHLGPGSTLAYRLESEPELEAGVRPAAPGGRQPGEDGALEIAARIGARLCREAIWHSERCTWQGWAMMTRGSGDELVWRSLGPDLYRGTSGISLFLARLYVHSREPRLRETALGGLAQALSASDRLEPEARLGLHTGLAGIGHAAIRVGALLERPDLIHRGLEALAEIETVELEPSLFDVVSGAAGCIPVLLDAHARGGGPRLLDLAVRLGRFLLEQARETDHGLAWSGDPRGVRPPLCGYSHGAAGVSVALADLHAATGEEAFSRAARSGLRYERAHFRPEAGNWLDLRSPPGSPASASAMAWCHGAPGIALSRLALLSSLGDDAQIQRQLDVAL
ncbi:MAG: T3SS effector HopA1 family protein, partial [Holophagales bacterium]|nr:T3SS effector HopA1 family protein [Holophagales bacterium]